MKKIITLTLTTATILSVPAITKAQICFSPGIDYEAGINPGSICSADFNGDGKPDLAIANRSGAGNVFLLLNNGTGGFGAPAAFEVGALPRSICTADFNGDGKADVATTNVGPGTVSILLGSGNGTFDTALTQTYATLIFNGASTICSDDFNGDGKADLLVSSGANYVWKAMGDGNGGFSTYRRVTADNNTHCVATGDFNGDGAADIAVTTNNGSSHVSVLLNMGPDSFSAATNFSIGNAPASLISADFNGDGKLDLATANAADNITGNISILYGDGTGGFAAAVTTSLGTSTVPKSMCSADVNGDGRNDLAIACIAGNNTANVSILPNNGAGGFGMPVVFAADPFPNGIIAADLNGDARPDLALSTAKTSIDTGSAFVLLNCITAGIGSSAAVHHPSKAYPNPSNGLLYVEPGTTASRIQITNILGQVIYAADIRSTQVEIDLTREAKGIYFYQLESDGHVLESGKVVLR